MKSILWTLPLLCAMALPAFGQSVPGDFTCHNYGYRTSILTLNDEYLSMTESFISGIDEMTAAVRQADPEFDFAQATLVIPRSALNCITGDSYQLACTAAQIESATLRIQGYDNTKKSHDFQVPVTAFGVSSVLSPASPNGFPSPGTLNVNGNAFVVLNNQTVALQWVTSFDSASADLANSYSACAPGAGN